MAQKSSNKGSEFLFVNWWGKRFVIIGGVVIVLAVVAASLWDQTEYGEFRLFPSRSEYVDTTAR